MASTDLIRRWQALDDRALGFGVMRLDQQMKSTSPTRLGPFHGSTAGRSQSTRLLCRYA
ncbi:MAG: hypothetical protein ACKO45_01840 [Cyanobium sp.]